MTIPEAKRITRMNEWRQLIHERQQSGQSVRAWCQQNEIRENSYYAFMPVSSQITLTISFRFSGWVFRIMM